MTFSVLQYSTVHCPVAVKVLLFQSHRLFSTGLLLPVPTISSFNCTPVIRDTTLTVTCIPSSDSVVAELLCSVDGEPLTLCGGSSRVVRGAVYCIVVRGAVYCIVVRGAVYCIVVRGAVYCIVVRGAVYCIVVRGAVYCIVVRGAVYCIVVRGTVYCIVVRGAVYCIVVRGAVYCIVVRGAVYTY